MKKQGAISCVIIISLSMIGTLGIGQDVINQNIFLDSTINETDINWQKHMIDKEITKASGIYSCDIDQDNDFDIIACGSNEVAYWENCGDYPFVWEKHTIDDFFEYPMDVIAHDVDHNGKIDVLGAAWDANEIALWLQTDQNPIKWSKQIIRDNYPCAHEVYACDLDLDGDIDVLGASAQENRIDWWRNDGGNPIKWTEQTIDRQFGGARSMVVADLNGDGENDVIGASFTDNEIAWWKNNGNEPIQWEKQVIDEGFDGAHFVTSADVDADGDMDILGAGYFANTFAWWSNEGGSPIHWEKQVIDDASTAAMKCCVADIDNDGDLDVIGSSSKTNQISWWSQSNHHPPTWEKHVVDPYCIRAWPIQVTDLDGDGDIDILGGSESTAGIMWYENSLSAGGDLEVEGNLIWSDVKPGSTHNSQLIIKNIDSVGTELSWMIDEYPTWGKWVCAPDSGDFLSVKEQQIVNITVTVPNEKNEQFNGSIKVVNQNNLSDYCVIDISITTQKSQISFYDMIMSLLRKSFLKWETIGYLNK